MHLSQHKTIQSEPEKKKLFTCVLEASPFKAVLALIRDLLYYFAQSVGLLYNLLLLLPLSLLPYSVVVAPSIHFLHSFLSLIILLISPIVLFLCLPILYVLSLVNFGISVLSMLGCHMGYPCTLPPMHEIEMTLKVRLQTLRKMFLHE